MNNNQLIINQAGLHKINKNIVSEIVELKAEKEIIALNMEQLQGNYENIKSENSKLNDYGKPVENENKQLLDYIQSIEKITPENHHKKIVIHFPRILCAPLRLKHQKHYGFRKHTVYSPSH